MKLCELKIFGVTFINSLFFNFQAKHVKGVLQQNIKISSDLVPVFHSFGCNLPPTSPII